MKYSRPNFALHLAAPSLLAAALAPLALAQNSPYQGVSHPPEDDSIETTAETPAPPPAAAKPSPAIPASASGPASGSVSGSGSGAAPTGAPRYPAQATQRASRNPDSVENPDYGIVTSVPGSEAATGSGSGPGTGPGTASAPAPSAGLVTRPQDPDYGIVGVIPSPSNQLPEGTDLRVRLMDELSTTTTQSGAPFHAQVAANVYKDGRVVIPIGSELRGRVVGVSQGHRFGRAATLRLRPDAVLLPDGSSYHLFAQLVHTDAREARTDSEGGVEPRSHAVKTMVEYGAGTGGGAVAGAMIAGPPGALGGALVGAGIVTAHLLLQHPRQARLEQGTEVTFSLSEPMDLVPSRN